MGNIREGYLAILRRLKAENPAAHFEVVTRMAHSVLAPSQQLLDSMKNGTIGWDEYVERFKEEILANPRAIARLNELMEIAKTKTVFLICYEKNPPCHRFILKDILEEANREPKRGC